jgi:hypothetical protein
MKKINADITGILLGKRNKLMTKLRISVKLNFRLLTRINYGIT